MTREELVQWFRTTARQEVRQALLVMLRETGREVFREAIQEVVADEVARLPGAVRDELRQMIHEDVEAALRRALDPNRRTS